MGGGGEKKTTTTFDQFWRTVSRTGGWVDRGAAEDQTDTLATPSGKFEFYARRLQSQFPTANSQSLFLPHFQRSTDAGDAADYPLHLVVYSPLAFMGGTGAELPYLQGLGGAHIGERRWETWVEIHPKTARERGIADGDWVEVESPAGRIRVRARLFEGAMPTVVSIPFGLGHTACGRWATGVGANPAELLETDATTGEPLWQQTRVRVRKAGE
jgi:anaerobic selenocysteine-containing dehydrogenase